MNTVTMKPTPVETALAEAKHGFMKAAQGLTDTDRARYLRELSGVLLAAVADLDREPAKHAFRDPSAAGAALALYDRTDRQIVNLLPHDDRELVLLSIIARAEQSLADMGRLHEEAEREKVDILELARAAGIDE